MVDIHEERLRPPMLRRISWGAIFAGLAMALVLQLLLSLLGLGVGAGTVHPTSENGASAQSVGTGSVIWFVIASLISLFAGGWVAGRVAGIPHRLDGVLHGLLAWSLTTLFTVYLLTTAVGSVLSGVTGALGSVFSAAGSGIAAAAPSLGKAASDQISKTGVTPDDITSKVQQVLRETGNAKLAPSNLKAQGKHQANLAKGAAHESAMNPGDAKQNYNDLVYRFLHDSGATSKSADRQSLINVVASEQHVSKEQATATVDGWAQEAQQAQQEAKKLADDAHEKAKQAGDATAAAVSKAAISAFFLFLLGGLAAAAGGFVSIRSIMAEGPPVTVTGRRPL